MFKILILPQRIQGNLSYIFIGVGMEETLHQKEWGNSKTDNAH